MILALNGGGIRGALQVGALLELSDSQAKTLFEDGIYGISVGAIIATYLAFGFTPSDLAEIFAEWVDVPLTPPSIAILKNVYSNKGLDDGSVIRERFRKNFLAKKGLKFDDLRIGDAGVPLHIIATDVENVQTVMFGKSMRVWDAVRASFSLPLVFEPHSINGKMFIDGAVLCSDISRCIPAKDIPNTFFLLTARSAPSESYIDVIWSGPSTRASHDNHKRHPGKTCLIVDNDTPTFDMWSTLESVKTTIERGRVAMREFLSGSGRALFLRTEGGN
jgi:hypothetical protein